MEKRILILGSGFLGSNLAKRWLKEKNCSIKIYSRNPPNEYLKEIIKDKINIEYICGDFQDIQKVSNALVDVDYVYHLIGTTIPQTSNADPVNDVLSNLNPTINLLKECVNHNIKRIIYASSGGTIYGIPSIIPIPETHPTFPLSSYAIVKLAIEKYLYMFKYLYGLDCCVLRVSNPYGNGQLPTGLQGAISIFLGKIARNEPIQIWGDGTITRDFIFIDDAMEAFYKASEDFNTDKCDQVIFNIGSGCETSLNEILGIMKDVVDGRMEVNYLPSRSFDVPRNVLDISLAKKVLEWEPRIELREGILKTWEWIKAHRI